jgi:hypothetical protein
MCLELDLFPGQIEFNEFLEAFRLAESEEDNFEEEENESIQQAAARPPVVLTSSSPQESEISRPVTVFGAPLNGGWK